MELFDHQNDEPAANAAGPRITSEAQDAALCALARLGACDLFVPPPRELNAALAASMRRLGVIDTLEDHGCGYRVRLTPNGRAAALDALTRAKMGPRGGRAP